MSTDFVAGKKHKEKLHQAKCTETNTKLYLNFISFKINFISAKKQFLLPQSFTPRSLKIFIYLSPPPQVSFLNIFDLQTEAYMSNFSYTHLKLSISNLLDL